MQAGGIKLNISTFNLETLAKRLSRKFQTQTTKHDISVNFPENFPPIDGDEERLLQALSNLLSNAIKYSPKGGPIKISGRTTSRDIIVSVSDSGIGLPIGELGQIFNRFHRAVTAETSHTQGAGLGLYLTRAVIEAHHGRIWVDSDQGHGSTFHFSIPIKT